MGAPIVLPISIVPEVVKAIATAKLINTVRDGVINFLVSEAKDLGFVEQ